LFSTLCYTDLEKANSYPKDPAAFGAERVIIKDACFDDLTLVNWEAKVKGEVECPFTFTDWEPLDTVAPRE